MIFEYLFLVVLIPFFVGMRIGHEVYTKQRISIIRILLLLILGFLSCTYYILNNT